MTPSIINTNNKNLNIKYNERLVKDIRKDEREKTLREVQKIINKYWNKSLPPDYKFKGIIIGLNKLKEKK